MIWGCLNCRKQANAAGEGRDMSTFYINGKTDDSPFI